MEKVFIYALKCPIFNVIRYVGQSVNPKERYENHRKGGKLYVKKWFVKLKELGLEPKLIILEEVLEKDANNREDYYIDKYHNEDYIFNTIRNRDIRFKENKNERKKQRKESNKEIVELKRKIIPFKNLTKTETLVTQHLVNNLTYKEICEKNDKRL